MLGVPDGDDLVAAVAAGPNHDSLTLGQDGAFDYDASAYSRDEWDDDSADKVNP